jgi:hypothetical protein
MLQRWPGRGSTRKARRHGRSVIPFARATRLQGRSRLGRLGSSMRATNEPSRASALARGRPFVASATRVGLPRCDRSMVDTAWAGVQGGQGKENVVLRKLLAQLSRWFGKKKA